MIAAYHLSAQGSPGKSDFHSLNSRLCGGADATMRALAARRARQGFVFPHRPNETRCIR